MKRFPMGLCVLAGLFLIGCTTTSTATRDPNALEQYRKDEMRGVYQVQGSVFHPGTFTLKPGHALTLLEALEKAGGTIPGTTWDSGAAIEDVRVLRPRNNAIVVYKLDSRPHHDGSGFIIKPGDTIFVPEVIL